MFKVYLETIYLGSKKKKCFKENLKNGGTLSRKRKNNISIYLLIKEQRKHSKSYYNYKMRNFNRKYDN